MPLNAHLKDIVYCAVAQTEAVIHTYPTHFHDIEEVKEYIGTTCKQADFQYMPSKDMTRRYIRSEELEYVKDKVCFIVAARAFKQGEFYLEVGLVDRSALRAAVEADIQRLLPLIPYWPSRFYDVSSARDHVDGIARWKQFAFTQFEGVRQQKFRGYVVFNTVRHAFEEGGFDMDCPGEGWRCRQLQLRGQEKKLEVITVPKTLGRRFATMREAIEFDIHRLLPLISSDSSWPVNFPTLNTARDHVFRFTQSVNFPFTYWPEVEHGRFRLFVNFNTAKRGLQLGKFKIGREAEGDGEVGDTDETAEDTEGTPISTLACGVLSIGSTVTAAIETPVISATTAFSEAIDSIEEAVADTTADAIPVSRLEEIQECVSIVQDEAQETTIPLEVKADEDPFKGLIAVLKRESILKEAFE